MTIELHELVGSLGVVLIVGAYLGLQLERIDPKRLPYSLVNALGSGLILVSLAFEWNLPSALIEGFWLAVSALGIWRHGRGAASRSAPRDAEPRAGVEAD